MGRKDERLRMANGLAAGDRESRAQTPPVQHVENRWAEGAWAAQYYRHVHAGTHTQEHTLPRESCSTLSICHGVSYSASPDDWEKEQRKEIDPVK